MFVLKRNLEVDFAGITLEDLVNHLKEENFFNKTFFSRGQDFYPAETISENELVFHVYRNHLFGSQVQNFKYLSREKKLVMKSKYKLFPGFYIPLIGMLLMVVQLYFGYENWIKVLITIIGLVLFGFIFGYLNLRFDSKAIERELIIRLNFLLRKKGYQMPL